MAVTVLLTVAQTQEVVEVVVVKVESVLLVIANSTMGQAV
jgi:hypothetical protein